MSGKLVQEYLIGAARNNPDKTAVKSGEKHITYGGLLRESAALSDCLMKSPAYPFSIAAVYLEKSIDAIIAMQGVLLSGAAYIPLDSQYSPAERIAEILRQSEVKLLITDSARLGLLEEVLKSGDGLLGEVRILLMDGRGAGQSKFVNFIDFDRLAEPESLYKKRGRVSSDSLAYILYTSGSTGEPKGVMISHLNACSFIDWAYGRFRPGGADVFASIAPFHFDLSVFDIYVSFKGGARLVLLPGRLNANPKALVKWIAEEKISYIYTVPSLWITLFNYTDIKSGDLKSLKKILFAGEVFPVKYLKMLAEISGSAELYNLYGPTETNVCTYHKVDKGGGFEVPVPIGRACGKAEIVILDDSGKPVDAEGERGELCVMGPLVMKGYYLKPEETEKHLKTCRLKGREGKPIYHTGDIVRILKNGAYDFVGRTDSLIKRAGFRIEMAEIEKTLYRHPLVEEAVVVDVMGSRQETIMCCAVKFKPGEEVTIVGLKEYIARHLPRYMVPDVIRKTDGIPRNNNDKIERHLVKKWFAD